MKTVFSLEHLNIGSELELFEAAMRHVEARDQRQAGSALPPDPGSPEPSATNKNVNLHIFYTPDIRKPWS